MAQVKKPEGERVTVRIGPQKRDAVKRIVARTDSASASHLFRSLIDRLDEIPGPFEIRDLSPSKK